MSRWNKPRDIELPPELAQAQQDINENFDRLFLALRKSPIGNGPGVLPVDSGGTGLGAVPIGDLLVGQGTPILALLPDVAVGSALISGGVLAAPSYGKIGLTTHVSGILPVANGGTGLASVTTGAIVVGQGTAALAVLDDVATGNALISGGVGVSPAYGKIGLTTHVAGTLPVANGGTGRATISAGLLVGSGTSPVGVITGGANTLLVGQGVGVEPAFASTLASLTVTGTVTAGTFSGSGASLTSIPETAITDGALLARLAASETITGSWTFNGVSNVYKGLNFIENATPQWLWFETDGALNEKYWRWLSSGGVFFLQLVDDALSTATDMIAITRSGTAVGRVDIKSAVAFSGQQSVTVSADQTAWSPTGLGTRYFFAVTVSGAPRTIRGLTAQAAGMEIVVVNVSTNQLVFNHEDAAASAANRIRCANALNVGINQFASARLIYDGANSRWHLVSAT